MIKQAEEAVAAATGVPTDAASAAPAATPAANPAQPALTPDEQKMIEFKRKAQNFGQTLGSKAKAAYEAFKNTGTPESFAPNTKPNIPVLSDGGIAPQPTRTGVPVLSDGGINPNADPKNNPLNNKIQLPPGLDKLQGILSPSPVKY